MSDNPTFRPSKRPFSSSELAGSEEFVPGGPPAIKGELPSQFKAAMERNQSVNAASAPEAAPAKQATFLSNAFAGPAASTNTPSVNGPKLQQVRQGSKLKDVLDRLKPVDAPEYTEVVLPSLGKFYDGSDGPQDGKISIRAMLGSEEQILGTPKFVKKGVAPNMILNKCITGGYDSVKFLSADRSFLLIYLRGISYSPDYTVDLKCPFTDRSFPYTINLNLPVEPCPEDLNPESLFGTLPDSGFQFQYRLPTGEDELRIKHHQENRATFDTSNMLDDTLLHRTALLIKDIEGLTSTEEIKILLTRLKMADISYIRSKVDGIPFGVNTKVPVISPYSGEEFEVEIPFGSDFFFPKTRKGAPKNQQA